MPLPLPSRRFCRYCLAVLSLPLSQARASAVASAVTVVSLPIYRCSRPARFAPPLLMSSRRRCRQYVQRLLHLFLLRSLRRRRHCCLAATIAAVCLLRPPSQSHTATVSVAAVSSLPSRRLVAAVSLSRRCRQVKPSLRLHPPPCRYRHTRFAPQPSLLSCCHCRRYA